MLPEAEANEPDDHVQIENAHLRLEFTAVGARLRRAWVLVGKTEEAHPQLVEMNPDVPDGKAFLPMDVLNLRPDESWQGTELSRTRWDYTLEETGQGVRFSVEKPGVARITKTFTLLPDHHLVDLDVAYENLTGHTQRLGMDRHIPAFSVTWEPNLRSGEEDRWGAQQSVVWRKGGENDSVSTSNLEPPASATGYSEKVSEPTWMAVRSTYFLMAMRPRNGLPEPASAPQNSAQDSAQDSDAHWSTGLWGWIAGTPEAFRVGLAVPRTEVAGGDSFDTAFRYYIGPTHLETLQTAADYGFPELEEALQFFTMFGFMDTFSKFLLTLLHFFHDSIYANYGVAIILLTILVRLVVFPLTLKSMKSMKRMQLLQPEIAKIKEEYGDEPQEFQKRTMELYKQYGVNPLGGCMPLMFQMPVFIALYRMLWSAFELRGAEFLWISDLSQQDALFTLPFEIPLVLFSIDSINLLPILMAVAMLISQKMTPTTAAVNPQQKTIMTVMPVMFSVILYNYASGLNLYILTSTLLGIGQNFLVRAQNVELTPKEQKPKAAAKRKPQHFYNAAQAKKREMAKEARKRKSRPKGKGASGEKR